MVSVPPSITISTGFERSARPVVMAATAVAQAPVPQAMVIPLPRSHTLVRKVFGAVATANSILHRCGNALSCSKALPRSVSTGVVGTSSAKMTKWGLPIETKRAVGAGAVVLLRGVEAGLKHIDGDAVDATAVVGV